jgi:hypothetical protein
MSLSYRSTVAEMVQIIVRDADGSKRVATLERDVGNPRRWTGSVDHPSGQRWPVDTFDPDAVAALDKLAHAFVSREVDFRQSKSRGHRPEPKAFDYNRQLLDGGDDAPITMGPRDSRYGVRR